MHDLDNKPYQEQVPWSKWKSQISQANREWVSKALLHKISKFLEEIHFSWLMNMCEKETNTWYKTNLNE